MPTPRALLRFVVHRLGLERYLAKPGDGRQQPVIAARVLLWAMLVGRLLRECSFLGVEQIVRAAGCRVLGLQRSFSNDALNYFVERLDPGTTRSALVDLVRQAKRDKAFQDCRFIGFAVDGTGTGRGVPLRLVSPHSRCPAQRIRLPPQSGGHECGWHRSDAALRC